MSYIINKTNGTVLTEVVDGTIDQLTTDLTLVGKNSTSYGELFNENFIRLLENFADTVQPTRPVEGQLWYDASEARLKVYDGTGFKVTGGTILSPSVPSGISGGDIWIDTATQRLYFNDGTANLLAGPIYTAQQGMSGWNVVDIVDTNQINHTTLFLYCGQVLLGIFSSALTPFTPATEIPGFTGEIKVGFNSANLTGIKFNVPSSQADALVAEDGSFKDAQSFLQVDPADGFTLSNGTIRILNSLPLVLGTNQNTEIQFVGNSLQFNSNVANQNFAIQSLNGEGLLPSFYISAQNKRVGIYTAAPTAMLDVAGDTRIRGNLTVEGSTTTINTTDISIEDLLIELGRVDTPTDSTANGGGISLAGTTDKTLTWVSSSNSWTSSENFNLATGKVYKINSFEVLSQTALGTTVNSALGLNSIGTLNQLQVDNININDSTISFNNPSIPSGNIVLTPKGSGVVSVSSKKITDVDTPTAGTDATNKDYVDNKVRQASLGFSVNIGALTEAQLAGTILSKIFPPADHDEDTFLRVYCLDTGISKEYKLIGPVWTYQTDI